MHFNSICECSVCECTKAYGNGHKPWVQYKGQTEAGHDLAAEDWGEQDLQSDTTDVRSVYYLTWMSRIIAPLRLLQSITKA